MMHGGPHSDLYSRLESLSKVMESSGRIDEHEHPDAYGAILDAMRFVAAAPHPPIAQPQAAGWRPIDPDKLTTGNTPAAAPSAPAPAEVPPHPERYYVWTDAEKRAIEAYAAAREAAAVERVRGVLEAAQNDAMRFRWLTEDHADPETRAKCRELLSRMGVMTYSAACTDIDSAMAQATKREMLRTAGEWQRRYEPTCAHGRYSDEDCADCQRTAAARAELGGKA